MPVVPNAGDDNMDVELNAEQQDALLEALSSAANGNLWGSLFPDIKADASEEEKKRAAVQLVSSGKRFKASHG